MAVWSTTECGSWAWHQPFRLFTRLQLTLAGVAQSDETLVNLPGYIERARLPVGLGRRGAAAACNWMPGGLQAPGDAAHPADGGWQLSPGRHMVISCSSQELPAVAAVAASANTFC